MLITIRIRGNAIDHILAELSGSKQRSPDSARYCTQASSGNDGVNHLSVHIRQPEIAAGVTIGEAFVVEAEQVQNRGVQVVDVDLVVNGAEAEGVAGAVRHAAPDAAAGQP